MRIFDRAVGNVTLCDFDNMSHYLSAAANAIAGGGA